ncbi:lipid-A-disaccharide synthase-related protein, partial [Merismopedia glauca]
MPINLLCLSNGHGEDAIAIRILEQLQQISPSLELAALPIVGEGKAYSQIGVPTIGSVKTMPSGGFIYMDGRQLVGDIKGGLLPLTLSQIKAVRNWVRKSQKLDQKSLILAVGDLVPLLFAYYSGANYAFVGTAKSEYYLRNESGLLPRQSWFEQLESWSGSVYLPWERWLMYRSRCQAVFPRDSLTTQILQRWLIPAYDLGNPMMDGIFPDNIRVVTERGFESDRSHLNITLLPGSRVPEAYENWQQIVTAI